MAISCLEEILCHVLFYQLQYWIYNACGSPYTSGKI